MAVRMHLWMSYVTSPNIISSSLDHLNQFLFDSSGRGNTTNLYSNFLDPMRSVDEESAAIILFEKNRRGTSGGRLTSRQAV